MKREATFLVLSETLTVVELTKAIGLSPDRSSAGTRRHPRLALWELCESGGGEDDLSSLIGRLLGRVAPFKEAIIACVEGEPSCRLRIVHYIGPAPIGPGFAVDRERVALLANLGADLDVDQYWLPPDSDEPRITKPI